MLAANNGHADTTRALLEAGAAAGARSRTGATARKLASTNGQSEIAVLLEDTSAHAMATAKK